MVGRPRQVSTYRHETGIDLPAGPLDRHTVNMRAHKRRRPRRRELVHPPSGVDLAAVAARAHYVGSGEHKSFPSFAGAPALRADASKCDPSLADAAELTGWLREAILAGQVGEPLESNSFPRYVWVVRGDTCYEGRLVNAELGQYKGYPLESNEWPEGLA